MSAANSFLKEFLSLRKSLQPSDISAGAAVGALGSIPPSATSKPKAKKKKEEKPFDPDVPPKEHTDKTLATIIEKKAGIKDLFKYFQQRANQLTVQKMAS